jgi:hypothetical protein
MKTLMGMDVQISELCNKPRMTLSEHVPVTLEFRAYMNKWMSEFFGRDEVIYKFMNPATQRETIVMSQSSYNSIKIISNLNVL